MSSHFLESAGAFVPGARRKQHKDLFSDQESSISATARKPAAHNTHIRADLCEAQAYAEAGHTRGEIGLQRPLGVNEGGPDFITAVRVQGEIKIVVTDVKYRADPKTFPSPKQILTDEWRVEVYKAAVLRVKLNDSNLEADIKKAYVDGQIYMRQLNVTYSPAGQRLVTGWTDLRHV
jgi:hypothetical protein